MLALSLLIKDVAGWIYEHRWVAFYALLAIFLFAVAALVLRSCNKPPKLDQQEIIKAQEAIEKQDRKVMVDILTNSDVREQAIDSNIKLAEDAADKAKRSYLGKTNEELAAELERRLKDQ